MNGQAQAALVRSGIVLMQLLPAAMAANFVLDVPSVVGVVPPEINWLQRGSMFLLSSLLLTFLAALIFSVVGRVLWAAMALAVVSVMIAFANQHKLQYRFEPLFAGDLFFLGQVSFLTSYVRGRDLISLAMVLALLIVIGVLGSRVASTARAREREDHSSVPARALLGLASLVVLSYASQFNSDDNAFRNAYEAAGARWVHGQQVQNYERHGFVAGFLHSVTAELMTQPPGYSASRLQAIARSYSLAGPAESSGKAAGDQPNVVVVLSESFTDPSELRAHSLGEDPLPRYRSLARNSASGTLITHHYGGGTANVEFAVLTGQAQVLFAPQVNTPFHQLLPAADHYPSFLDTFEARGYDTLAVHPFDPSMYMRTDAYRALGFDRFLSAEDVPETRDGFLYRSDFAAFDLVAQELRRETRPQFVNLVTMQNHGPYSGLYDDPIPVDGPASEAELAEFSHYARGLSHTDQALQEFVHTLGALEEDTIVLFFGDHHPGIWSSTTRSEEPSETFSRTPFLVWSTASNKPVDLGAVSPHLLMPLAMDYAGLPIPPWASLLMSVRQVAPVLEPGQPVDLEERRVLDDFALAQYDLSVGQGFAQEQLLGVIEPGPETD